MDRQGSCSRSEDLALLCTRVHDKGRRLICVPAWDFHMPLSSSPKTRGSLCLIKLYHAWDGGYLHHRYCDGEQMEKLVSSRSIALRPRARGGGSRKPGRTWRISSVRDEKLRRSSCNRSIHAPGEFDRRSLQGHIACLRRFGTFEEIANETALDGDPVDTRARIVQRLVCGKADGTKERS